MITVTQILPAKNSVDVSVNQDIEIMLTADFKLDPRNISFKLNEVDIVPNVFSVYNGVTDYSLVVTLYTRKRIKYGDEYRYGQLNTRYGMRDNFPSMLEYGCRYVCSFTVWGTNDSNEREEITDSFVFNTEEGVFYNSNPADYFYSDFSQSIANKMPEWSKARFDKYSNFQQLVNPLAEILEKKQDHIDKVYRGNLIQTLDLNQLPYLFKYELDKNYEFKTFLNQDGSSLFVQPDISGIQGITRFDLFAPENNDLKTLYYLKTPTRINTKQDFVNNNVIFEIELISNLKIDIDRKLEREGGFVLYCENLKSSIKKVNSTSFVLAKCQVKGISIFDKEQQEEIILYNEKFLFSKKMWKKIDSIQFFNVDQKNVTFTIMHFPDERKTSPDTKKIILPDGSSNSILWSFENRNDLTVLQKRRTIGRSGLDVLKFAGATEIVSELGLFDTNNTTPLELIDLTVDYNSNFIYGVTSQYLYIFDKREPYPKKLKNIPGDSGSSDFVLKIESDGTYLDEAGEKEILIKYSHVTPGRKIIKYRTKITKPDNSVVYLLKDGATTSDPNQSSIFVKQDLYTLDDVSNRFYATEAGEYIFELETMYQGGVSSKDYGFVYIPKICAIAKYKLERILDTGVPVSIFKDFDQNIKIYTNEGILHSIIFHKDGILIDYVNKVLYSSEEYTSLDVE
jgi:hypothetical protein